MSLQVPFTAPLHSGFVRGETVTSPPEVTRLLSHAELTGGKENCHWRLLASAAMAESALISRNLRGFIGIGRRKCAVYQKWFHFRRHRHHVLSPAHEDSVDRTDVGVIPSPGD